MAQSERKRIIIDIPYDNLRYSRLYSHMIKSPDGIKKKILDACDIQYYSFALADINVDKSEILDESIVSVGRLHVQIQAIVGKLRSLGIQPTPEMLALAQAWGSNNYTPAAIPTNPPLSTPITNLKDNSGIDDWDEEDDWTPTEAELAYLKKSQDMDLEANAK